MVEAPQGGAQYELFIISFIFFVISHVNSFRTQLQQKRERADEMREKARRNGYEYLVEAADRFLAKHFTAFTFTDFKTLEREILELVAYQIANARMQIESNGQLLTEKLLKELFEAGLDEAIFNDYPSMRNLKKKSLTRWI